MIIHCKICGARTKSINHLKLGNYNWCEKCEFISKDELSHISREEALSIYNNHNNSIDDPRYVDFFNKFLNESVYPYVGHEKKGFDFGSGPSPVLAQILERNYNFEMDIYDLFYSPKKVYIGNKYDLVTSTEVIEHLSNPIEYFELFVKLLKEKGVLAIMTLFHHNDKSHFLDWHYIRDKSHVSFYTPKTMRFIAERVGLKLVYTNDIRYMTFTLDN